MAVVALLHQLNTLMGNMYSTGSVDDQFYQLQSLEDEVAPDFISEVITLFSQDSERIINELTNLLEKPVVDYDRVDAFVHQLKGNSASIGAARVKNTCVQFRKCCQNRNRDGCLKTLESVRTEFLDLRNKFQTMLQLEQQIQAYYPKQ